MTNYKRKIKKLARKHKWLVTESYSNGSNGLSCNYTVGIYENKDMKDCSETVPKICLVKESSMSLKRCYERIYKVLEFWGYTGPDEYFKTIYAP